MISPSSLKQKQKNLLEKRWKMFKEKRARRDNLRNKAIEARRGSIESANAPETSEGDEYDVDESDFSVENASDVISSQYGDESENEVVPYVNRSTVPPTVDDDDTETDEEMSRFYPSRFHSNNTPALQSSSNVEFYGHSSSSYFHYGNPSDLPSAVGDESDELVSDHSGPHWYSLPNNNSGEYSSYTNGEPSALDYDDSDLDDEPNELSLAYWNRVNSSESELDDIYYDEVYDEQSEFEYYNGYRIRSVLDEEEEEESD